MVKFGEPPVVRQICQGFPPLPKIDAIQYSEKHLQMSKNEKPCSVYPYERKLWSLSLTMGIKIKKY